MTGGGNVVVVVVVVQVSIVGKVVVVDAGSVLDVLTVEVVELVGGVSLVTGQGVSWVTAFPTDAPAADAPTTAKAPTATLTPTRWPNFIPIRTKLYEVAGHYPPARTISQANGAPEVNEK